jgi:hypothetical protein
MTDRVLETETPFDAAAPAPALARPLSLAIPVETV